MLRLRNLLSHTATKWNLDSNPGLSKNTFAALKFTSQLIYTSQVWTFGQRSKLAPIEIRSHFPSPHPQRAPTMGFG